VEAIAMDMWKPYVQSTLAHVPGAAGKIVHDPFHLVKYMNEAVNEVRKSEHRRLLAQGDDTLKSTRFPQARQQLDLWHAEEHLWAVAHDLHGRGTPEACAWVKPLLQQVRSDQTSALIANLTELKPRLLEAQQKKLQTQIEYFEHNAHRMKYKEVIAAREAVVAGTATAEQFAAPKRC